jgi:oligopeptide/dipeptide ABC transporter ATP-binding protein
MCDSGKIAKMKKNCVLNVEKLSVCFSSREANVEVIDDVSFDVQQGETLALVGESGCGKSITALALSKLLPKNAFISGGSILLAGRDIAQLNELEMQKMRGEKIAYIFQDVTSSLNPVMTVGSQIKEALKVHRRQCDFIGETIRLLDMVGIPDANTRLNSYPFEMSGGMQQRIMIAMAIACNPLLLVADEPTTALDVTIQAQILALLKKLQKINEMAILLITHNLGIVADVADRVCVMYAGRIVEEGTVEEILSSPSHPYTQGLLLAVPTLAGSKKKLKGIPGLVPSPGKLPSGCKFHPRCPKATELCKKMEPELFITENKRKLRCHYWK